MMPVEYFYDEHFQDAQNVEVLHVGVFGEDDNAEAEVPRVFGVVFGATAPRVHRLAEDLLEPVAFGDEFDLLREAQGGRFRVDHEIHEIHETGPGNIGA